MVRSLSSAKSDILIRFSDNTYLRFKKSNVCGFENLFPDYQVRQILINLNLNFQRIAR